MSVDITRGYDSFFGPPSELIPVQKFLDDTTLLAFSSASSVRSHAGWQNLSEDERAAVEAECSGSVAELKTTVEDVWDDPVLSAHLRCTHAAAVNAVYSTAGSSASKGRKRKYLPNPDRAEAQSEMCALDEKLETISLQCWGLNQESAFFMRASKHPDFNALRYVKKSGHGALNYSQLSSRSPCLARDRSTPPPSPNENSVRQDALITLSVHNRVPWVRSQLTRFSQHIVLSSQTLADFVWTIPCDSGEIPNEVVDSHGNVDGYTYENRDQAELITGQAREGYLLLIEGVAYGDGRPGDDYSEKLLSQLLRLPVEKRPQISKSLMSLDQTPFTSLSLRINQPYWMLHQGNCEHFIVVDQIRLAHPCDPPSGYPLTVHLTPTLGDICKACAKVPAVLTVIGDIRLGESPCLLCAPCWRDMGSPREEDAAQVKVVPLVRHRRVWEDV